MKQNGWQGDPAVVFEHKGTKYLIDGHHRTAAARRAGVDVQYKTIPESDLSKFGYKNIEAVIDASSSVRPDKLRL